MIAAVCGWHEHHSRALDELEQRLGRREVLVAAAPALVEAYAVLTRLPAPHRLAPADALNLLDTNFMRSRRIVALDGRNTASLLRSGPVAGFSGGRTYDAVIALCARKARVAALLTFNQEHFLPFADEHLEIVVP